MSQTSLSESINDFDPLAEVYDQLVSWAPYQQWIENLLPRLRSHGLNDEDQVLDVACGTGLSSIPLADRGYDVVGVDRSIPMLAQARKRAREAGVDVDFRRADLLAMNLERQFDLVLCMHSGLDYILDIDRLQQAFEVLRRHTREGGLLTFDKCLDEPSFYQEPSSNSRSLSNGTAVFHYSWDRANKIFQQRCVILREGDEGEAVERTEVVHKMLAVEVNQLIDMAERAGFEVLERPRQFTISDPGMGIFRAVR